MATKIFLFAYLNIMVSVITQKNNSTVKHNTISNINVISKQIFTNFISNFFLYHFEYNDIQ